jgi:RNA polymerase sigma-70 factor, ECF subfamily
MHEDDSTLNKLLVKDLDTGFSALVRAYGQRLYSYAFYKVGSQSPAEEIVQKTFSNAYKALKRTSAEEILSMKLGPWLMKIVHNLFLNYQRDEKHQRFFISLDLPEGRTRAEEMEVCRYPSPEAEVESKETLDELYACIRQLPDHFRIVVALYYIGNLSYSDIAKSIGQPLNTVKSNGQRGLRKLREIVIQKNSIDEKWR